MKVKWLGHSCFLLTSDAGVRIITDPYKREGGLNYGELNESADVVLVSHEHYDHNNAAEIKGKPQVIKGPGIKEAKGIMFKGIATFHDETGGSKRGNNTVFVFEVDGLRFCHLGDLGHSLGNKELADIGKVDVLFVPIGGLYTCDPGASTSVVAQLSPRITIPMHYKTSKIDTAKFGGICGVDEFLKGKRNVRELDSSETELKTGRLPTSTQVLVLKPAL